MIPVPWVNHLAVGPGLPLSAPGESAPRPGAPELHFASRAMKTSLRAGFFWSIVIRRGTGAPYTWASREETLVPTLAAQTVLRVSYRKAATAADVLYLAYGRSTCPELASRVDTKVSHDDTVEWKESQQPKRRCFVGSTRTNLRDGK